jgi:GT2 family glycosyltransferase
MQKIFAVIPTFNREEMLDVAIQSLLSQSIPIYSIVIINSSSTECTSKMLRRYESKVHEILSDKDCWWAECMNIGIEYSLSHRADYILAMNDDTYLDPNALKYLLQSSNEYKGGIIGGIVKDKNNSSQMINRGYGARYTKFRWIPYKKKIGEVDGREIYYTEGQSGRGVLFPKSVYERVGLYDIANFSHRGDRDFSYRCLKAGVSQYLDSGAVVYLNFETSYEGLANKRFTIDNVKKTLFHTNGMYNVQHQYNFLKKHYKFSWPLWLLVWLMLVTGICFIRVLPNGTNMLKRIS